MGHAAPRKGPPLRTHLEMAKRRFINGSIDLERFEAVVEQLIFNGTADVTALPSPPRKTGSAPRAFAIEAITR